MFKLAVLFCLLSTMTLRANAAGSVTLSTDDTRVRIVYTPDGRLVVASLRGVGGGHDWLEGIHEPTPIPLIATAEVGGRSVSVQWHLHGMRKLEGAPGVHAVAIEFDCASPRMTLESLWCARPGPGPIEHTISITNRSGEPILIPLQNSLALELRAPAGHVLKQWWVEKGAGAPSGAGTHCDVIGPGAVDRSLVSTGYSEDAARDAIPWMSIQDASAGAGLYAGIESSGRVRERISKASINGAVRVELGLDPGRPGGAPYRSRLPSGETLRTPTVFVGCYSGDVDDGANRLRPWVQMALRPPVHDSLYPRLTLNSWGGGMAIDEPLAGRMIEDADRLGLEMFHIDAGWFRSVGDWRPNPAKFPHGLAAISAQAHSHGLKFGLWVGWTQGGTASESDDRQTVLNVHSPDRKGWFTHDYAPDWKPADFVGADLCLSDPNAESWCLALLDRLVQEYGIDMLEHDQRMVVDRCDRLTHSHTASPTDISFRAANGYYRVYDQLRARHPKLLFENCVNGGRMVDYGAVKRAHYFSITDTYNPLANRRAFYDTSYALPPSMCECYVENVPVKTDAEFRTMLRSGLMGWCTIMCDTNRWSAAQHTIARRQFSLYKTALRPLINSGNLYHVSERPDGARWDGMQYASQDRGSAVLFAFRGSSGPPEHVFHLRGLAREAAYRVRVEDGPQKPIIRTGLELMERGITVNVPDPGGSEIVTVTRQ